MKQFLLLITTAASLTLQAQDSNPGQKISIGFNFSPDYSFRTLKNTDNSSASELVINSRNDIEIARFGYTTGLTTNFNFSQLVGFETGLQFSNKGYKTKKQDLTFIPPNPALPTKIKSTYAYQYIGIPLIVKFYMGKSKVRFVSGVGIMANFLLNVKQTSNYEYANGNSNKETEASKYGFNKIDISPGISAGIDYRINNKTRLFAEPTFRYGIIKTKDAAITENLWNAGLNMGLQHAIK